MNKKGPLADHEIVQRLVDGTLTITPIADGDRQIGSISVDLRLGTRWQVLKSAQFASLDPRLPAEEMEHLLRTSADEFRTTAGKSQGLVLHPGQLLLALSLEFLSLPPDLSGQLEGRSTWARVGLQVHATAGMVDPGFNGYLTYELQNTGNVPLTLFPGLRVAQIAFFETSEATRVYADKPSASYSAQYSVNTAFARQYEHRLMIEDDRDVQGE